MMIQVVERLSPRAYAFGKWLLRGNSLSDGVQTTQLPPKELAVMHLLLDANGELVGKDLLLDRVWGDGEVSEESLTRCIYSLRKALRGDKGFIASVYGQGYRFTCSVMALVPSVEQTCVLSLAILPFRGEGGVPIFEFHERLVRRLSRAFAPVLRVLPSTLTAGLGQGDGMLRGLECLAPDYYLAGRWQGGSGWLRVSLELVRRSDHTVIHAECLNTESAEMVIQRLGALLIQRIPGLRKQVSPLESSDSYPFMLAYVRGHKHLQAYTPNSLEKALNYFRQCVKLDSHYVGAWLALTDVWLAHASLGLMDKQQALDLALEAVGKALGVDPDHEAALTRLALLTGLQGSSDAAEALFRRAMLTAEPFDVWYHYAWYRLHTGELSEALHCIENCLEHDPHSVCARLLKLRIVAVQDPTVAGNMVKEGLRGVLRGHPVAEVFERSLRSERPLAQVVKMPEMKERQLGRLHVSWDRCNASISQLLVSAPEQL